MEATAGLAYTELHWHGFSRVVGTGKFKFCFRELSGYTALAPPLRNLDPWLVEPVAAKYLAIESYFKILWG